MLEPLRIRFHLQIGILFIKGLGDTGITSSTEEMMIRPIFLYLFQGMVESIAKICFTGHKK